MPRESNDYVYKGNETLQQRVESLTDKNSSCWGQGPGYFFGVRQATQKLEGGVYYCGMSDANGPILLQRKMHTDELIRLPDSGSDKIIKEFEEFWTLKEKYAEHKLLYKRGVLLYGPPGSGKTSAIQIMMQKVIKEQNGIAVIIDIDAFTAAACLSLIRKIEPDRPLIVVIEDIDGLITRYDEAGYLSLLDGEAQIPNVFFVATTNYRAKLDRRFWDRPSRFDLVQKIGMPDADARRMYLKNALKDKTDDEIEDIVTKTENSSIAHLKELVVSMVCFGRSLDSILERFEEMGEIPAADEAEPKPREQIGFNRNTARGRNYK